MFLMWFFVTYTTKITLPAHFKKKSSSEIGQKLF